MKKTKKILDKVFNYFHLVCDGEIEAPKWIDHLAQFFYWLASGTDCRCCLGARTFIGLMVGLMIGAIVG